MNLKHAFATLVATCAALASVGCNSQSAKKNDESKPDATPTPITATAPATVPSAALGTSDNAYAPLSPTPELDAAIKTALASKDKAKVSEAYTIRGAYRTRGDEKAGQRVKYRAALSDFRKALEANPKNTDAAAGKNEIEQIYAMMGREIPSPEECDEVSRTGRYTPKDPSAGTPKPKP